MDIQYIEWKKVSEQLQDLTAQQSFSSVSAKVIDGGIGLFC